MQVTIIIDGDAYGTLELTRDVPEPIRRMTVNAAPDIKASSQQVILDLTNQAIEWTNKNIR